MSDSSKQTVQVMNWMDQVVKDQMAWAKDVAGHTNPETLKAYEAGLRYGFMQAYQTLKLHGLVQS